MSFARHLLKVYCVAPENIHTHPKKGYKTFPGKTISKAYIFLRIPSMVGVSKQNPSLEGLVE